jgi:hypothetical protein
VQGNRGRSIGLALGLLAGIVSCQAPPVQPVVQAERFVAALNARDVQTMVGLTADPFLFREQRWRSAPDGSGYVLGATADTSIVGTEARRAFLAGLAERVHVRGTTAAERPPTREALLDQELAGADPRWAALVLFVFLRGEGDVEHTALTGVDDKSGKVAAFYVN